MNIKHKLLKRGFIMAACIMTMSILAVRESMVCTVEHIIWMPRDKQADPLYRFESAGGKTTGYIDRSGKVVIEPQFSRRGNYGGEFRNGLMEIGVSGGEYVDTTGKLSYYINRQGEQAFSERFTLASHFFKGLAHVKLKPDSGKNIRDADANGSFAYIDATGRKIFVYAY